MKASQARLNQSHWPVALARQVFVPEVRGFLQRYPKLTLELGCSDRTIDLVQEGVDCTVRGGDLPDSGLVARRRSSATSAARTCSRVALGRAARTFSKMEALNRRLFWNTKAI